MLKNCYNNRELISFFCVDTIDLQNKNSLLHGAKVFIHELVK